MKTGEIKSKVAAKVAKAKAKVKKKCGKVQAGAGKCGMWLVAAAVMSAVVGCATVDPESAYRGFKDAIAIESAWNLILPSEKTCYGYRSWVCIEFLRRSELFDVTIYHQCYAIAYGDRLLLIVCNEYDGLTQFLAYLPHRSTHLHP